MQIIESHFGALQQSCIQLFDYSIKVDNENDASNHKNHNISDRKL